MAAAKRLRTEETSPFLKEVTGREKNPEQVNSDAVFFHLSLR